jgi:hypothetical protein
MQLYDSYMVIVYQGEELLTLLKNWFLYVTADMAQTPVSGVFVVYGDRVSLCSPGWP